MLDPPTHNRPFADKCDKVGMNGVPKSPIGGMNFFERPKYCKIAKVTIREIFHKLDNKENLIRGQGRTRFEITIIPLILFQIIVVMATFFMK